MNLDKEYQDLILNVSVRAALSSYNFVGKKDKIKADKAAVDSMRTELNRIDMKGRVVIGEGELDEAPMLYIGEKLGTLKGPESRQYRTSVDSRCLRFGIWWSAPCDGCLGR